MITEKYTCSEINEILIRVFDNGYSEVTLHQNDEWVLNKYTIGKNSYKIDWNFFTEFVIRNYFIETSVNYKTNECHYILDMNFQRMDHTDINISYIIHIYREMILEEL